jgi:hypothetical protein
MFAARSLVRFMLFLQFKRGIICMLSVREALPATFARRESSTAATPFIRPLWV